MALWDFNSQLFNTLLFFNYATYTPAYTPLTQRGPTLFLFGMSPFHVCTNSKILYFLTSSPQNLPCPFIASLPQLFYYHQFTLLLAPTQLPISFPIVIFYFPFSQPRFFPRRWTSLSHSNIFDIYFLFNLIIILIKFRPFM